MPKTAPPQAGRAQATSIWRGRALRIALPVVGLIGAAVAVTLIRHHDGSVGSPAFSPADHQVTYQVAGVGTAREITYSVGAANPTVLHEVGLPWQSTVKVAVGVGGDVVNLYSTNPGLEENIAIRRRADRLPHPGRREGDRAADIDRRLLRRLLLGAPVRKTKLTGPDHRRRGSVASPWREPRISCRRHR